jgi:GTP-binding protein YchF
MGLVGFPTVGKTTLFNILTDAHAETSRFGAGARVEAHVGVARVPDPRLAQLAAICSPQKTTPATIEYVDVAGFRKEEADTGLALTELRNSDALLHVVRAFRDPAIPHSEGEIDPGRDIETMETALLLADHGIATKRADKLRASIPKTGRADEKHELEVMERVLGYLESERPLRELDLGEEESRSLRGFAFLSARPILHVINLGEEDIAHVADFVDQFGLEGVARRSGTGLVPLSARIEQELTELPGEDAAAFQADLGLAESCRPRVIRASYELLGLISFFTTAGIECRAWSVPDRTPAREAAGTIHTDMERGFIRAEVIGIDDLLECGSPAVARERGLLRLEGKDYPVQDGDVITFRFNV